MCCSDSCAVSMPDATHTLYPSYGTPVSVCTHASDAFARDNLTPVRPPRSPDTGTQPGGQQNTLTLTLYCEQQAGRSAAARRNAYASTRRRPKRVAHARRTTRRCAHQTKVPSATAHAGRAQAPLLKEGTLVALRARLVLHACVVVAKDPLSRIGEDNLARLRIELVEVAVRRRL